MRALFLFFLISLCCQPSFSQRNSLLLDSIIRSNKILNNIISNQHKFKPQIIFTQINRDSNNRPSFVQHTYLLDSNNYFYCASLVKLPCAILALEKINNLKIKDLNKSTIMLTDSAGPCQKRTWSDTSAANGFPSIEHHIKKMLLVSDNDSYGRIFEFLKPAYIHKRLTELGFPQARIVQRFDADCISRGNRYFNPIRFVDNNLQPIYVQPADSLSENPTLPFKKIIIGNEIYNRHKKQVSQKKDFTSSNYLSLSMVHSMLQNLVFDQYSPPDRRYKLEEEDRRFLMKHLAMYPRESEFPKYNLKVFYDSYKKYFLYGGSNEIKAADSVRVFNIVGRSYGFLSDCAYIVNYKTGLEFMLSAVIYTNAKNSFGSGVYEYENLGLPFLKELSLALYRFENKRPKARLPDLESLNFFNTP